MKAEELIKKYSLDKKKIESWGKEKYPLFQNNLRLITLAYLTQELGISIDAFELGFERHLEVTPVKDLQKDVFSEIRVLIASKISDFEYLACPECNKKIDDSNSCPVHGKVKAEIATWRKYIAGDETGDVVLTFPPRLKEERVLGRVVVVRGTLRSGRDEFVCRTVRVVEEVPQKDRKEGKDKETEVLEISSEELETFKKFVQVYGGVPKKQLKAWHDAKGLESSLEQLIKAAQLQYKDGKYYVKG